MKANIKFVFIRISNKTKKIQMKPRYSFSSKRTKRATKSPKLRKQKIKYPNLVDQIVKESDIILQILDARFISETRNLGVEKEIKKQKKTLIYVMNKSDLVKQLKKEELKGLHPAVLISCIQRKGIKDLRNKIKFEANKVEKKEKGERIAIGIIGYPNTGKSTLINLLIGKSSAGTGAEAGFTKGIQKLRLTSEIVLLDSPGVIPREEYSTKSEAIAQHTKVSGRSYSQVKDPEMVIADLIKEIPGVFEKFYKIKSLGNSEILLEKLGREKGFIKKGDQVNFDKTARLILKDWQTGKINI